MIGLGVVRMTTAPISWIAAALRPSFAIELIENTDSELRAALGSGRINVLRAVTEPLAPNGTPRQDLRFLDSLSMYVSSPGMPEVLVAQSVPAPDPDGGTPPDGAVAGATFAAGVFSADVPVASDVELKDYVTAASMTVRTDIVANGKPALSCTVRFSTTMSVQVTAAGVLSRLPLPLP